MQNAKKKTSGNEDSKKERHIVTWTQEVPFLILKLCWFFMLISVDFYWWLLVCFYWFWLFLIDFVEKYCRWYTYLNSDFKKGGWSPKEDLLLCEVIDTSIYNIKIFF